MKSIIQFVEEYLSQHNIETYYEFGKYLCDSQFKHRILEVSTILDPHDIVCRILLPTDIMLRIVSRYKKDSIEICVDTESTPITTANCIEILDKYVCTYSHFVKISSLYLAPAVMQANATICSADHDIQSKVRSQKVQELQEYAKQVCSICNV